LSPLPEVSEHFPFTKPTEEVLSSYRSNPPFSPEHPQLPPVFWEIYFNPFHMPLHPPVFERATVFLLCPLSLYMYAPPKALASLVTLSDPHCNTLRQTVLRGYPMTVTIFDNQPPPFTPPPFFLFSPAPNFSSFKILGPPSPLFSFLELLSSSHFVPPPGLVHPAPSDFF